MRVGNLLFDRLVQPEQRSEPLDRKRRLDSIFEALRNEPMSNLQSETSLYNRICRPPVGESFDLPLACLLKRLGDFRYSHRMQVQT